MLIADALSNFLLADLARGLSPATLAIYRYHLSRLTRFAFERTLTRLDQIDPHVLREFFADMHTSPNQVPFAKQPKRGFSPHTIDQAHRSLRTFFTWCVAEGLLATSPMLRIARPKLPQHKVPRLELSQVRELLAAAERTALPERNRALILLMVDSGLRVGEVVQLRCRDVRMDARRIRVIGKSDKERDVPFSPLTREAILNWEKVRPLSREPYLFVSAAGTPLQRNVITQVLNRLRRKLGWEKLYPHLLRHTFAKLFIRKGDLRSLQLILGHADVATTAMFYLDPDFDELKDKHDLASPSAQW